MPLAPMLAAAMSRERSILFMRRAKRRLPGAGQSGLSLWRQRRKDWLTPDGDAPLLRYLPSNLWLIGLGHLGQAYLWALGLLPYPDLAGASLILQDTDLITPSTWSTSILTDTAMAGAMKTRAMASWAEQRGFGTRIHERLFDASFTRRDDEPAIALCGIDNARWSSRPRSGRFRLRGRSRPWTRSSRLPHDPPAHLARQPLGVGNLEAWW